MTGAGDLAISVVVPTYARHDSLAETLASLRQQTLAPARFEIVVVDNSPDQAHAARIAETHRAERLRYLLQPVSGAALARNTGAAAANAPLIAFIDDDIVADRGWLAGLLEAFAAFPAAGVIGGRVRLDFGGARPDWLPDALLTYLSLVDLGPELRVKKPNEWFASANMAVSRAVFDAVGGFATTLGRVGGGLTLLSNEDVDFVDRIVAAGRSAIYAPGAAVTHRIDAARLTPEWFRRRAAWQAVSDFLSRPEAAAKASAGAKTRLRLLAQARRDYPPGFFTPPGDAKATTMDTQTAYYAVLALLAGGVEIDAAWIERFLNRPQADSSSESQ